MDNSLSKEATDWREGRRLRAFELRKAKERLRHKRDVILGCIRQPGFEV